MTEQLQNELHTRMQTLPKELQEVITTFGWEKISEDIGRKYLFDEDGINKIQAEIILVILGLEFTSDFAENIETNVQTSKRVSDQIAKDVFAKIFDPMANSLQEIIKKNLNNKVITWQQNLDFILSGGDYTVFILRPKKSDESDTESLPLNKTTSKFDDLKSKFTI